MNISVFDFKPGTSSSILTRLLLGNLTILLFVGILGAVVTFNLSRLQKLTRDMVDVNGAGLITGNNLLASFSSLVKMGDKYTVAGDIDYHNRFQDLKKEFAREMESLEPLLETREQRAQLINAKKSYNTYIDHFDQAADTIRQGGIKNGTRISLELDHALKQLTGSLKEIIALHHQKIAEKTNQSNRMARQIFLTTSVITLLTIMIGMVVSALVTRSITTPMSLLKKKPGKSPRAGLKRSAAYRVPRRFRAWPAILTACAGDWGNWTS